MLVEIQMPELGAEVTEGTLLAWLVAVGDTVSAGDPIAELETDKATVELEAEIGGTVAELAVAEGSEGIVVGALLARIEAAEGDVPTAPPAVEAAPSAKKAPAAAPAEASIGSAGDDVAASPLARRVAERAGVSLNELSGSGARGKIRRTDVDAATGAVPRTEAVAPAPAPVAAKAPPAAPALEDGSGELIRHSAMRRTIARRLMESKQTIPHFYLRIACRVDELMSVRKTVNETGTTKVSVNDFVVRAVALSLRDVPAANVSWTDEGMIQHASIGVSVAVATDGGLITPVVRNADKKGLAALANEIRDLALRARDGKLSPAEYQGGSISVSNLGMYGIETVYPIVNPPQACILGVGAASAQAVVVDGQIEVGHVMMCTLSADHRAVDGAVGAEFLVSFKKFIEDPISMVL